ncbi:MAG TPA: hypothetical protein VMF58_11050, partial [Rhizomicrobium sp.]|nr:hypothetical protein [Rhizomicrobium sp.]
GPFKWLLGSPEFHHWYHSNEHAARDRNFAAIFSLWDVAFGTVFLPGDAPRVYGIDEPVPPGYADQLLHPFRPALAPVPEPGGAAEGPVAPLAGGGVSQSPAIL